MIVVNLNEVIVPENRYRREFNKQRMDELRDSILRNGLLHAFTVERVNGQIVLRAGERRLRVLRELAESGHQLRSGDTTFERGQAPAVDFSELNDLRRLEIEVEETCVRADFTWQERDRAYAALHRLRQTQNPGQTLRDTATEILGKPAAGEQINTISEAIIIDRHLNDPDVAKAPNRKAALKVIKKKQDLAHNALLARVVDRNKVPHKLFRGDALEILKTLPAGAFDVICTDPPYGIEADSFGSQAATGHDYNDSKKWFKEQFLPVVPDELGRVAKQHAHLYMFCDLEWFDELKTHLLLAGWTPFRTPLLWDKCGTGMLPYPDYAPRRTYEFILYAWRGDRKVLSLQPDVIRVPAIRELKHGAQKPVALYHNLLARSARPGDSVLDCFGGTGPILVAANRLRLTATYIESNQDAFNIATNRAATSDLDDGAREDDGIKVDL